MRWRSLLKLVLLLQQVKGLRLGRQITTTPTVVHLEPTEGPLEVAGAGAAAGATPTGPAEMPLPLLLQRPLPLPLLPQQRFFEMPALLTTLKLQLVPTTLNAFGIVDGYQTRPPMSHLHTCGHHQTCSMAEVLGTEEEL